MRYLKEEIYDSDDDAAWQRCLKAYMDQLELLRPRLSKRAHQFFSTVSLHDGTLLSLSVGDAVDAQLPDSQSLSRNARKTKVVIKVLNYEQDSLYTLRFDGISRLLIDAPIANEVRPVIDDFLYAELTAVDESHLRYEILFSSGTTVAIEFKRFSFEREDVLNSVGPVYD